MLCTPFSTLTLCILIAAVSISAVYIPMKGREKQNELYGVGASSATHSHSSNMWKNLDKNIKEKGK